MLLCTRPLETSRAAKQERRSCQKKKSFSSMRKNAFLRQKEGICKKQIIFRSEGEGLRIRADARIAVEGEDALHLLRA